MFSKNTGGKAAGPAASETGGLDPDEPVPCKATEFGREMLARHQAKYGDQE